MKKTTAVTETATPLSIKFPAIFDIKPAHTIALPNGCTAKVYNTTEENWECDSKGVKRSLPKKAWRVLITNKSGRTPRALQGYRSSGDFTSSNPLEIRRFIEGSAWALVKVKVTTVHEEDGED